MKKQKRKLRKVERYKYLKERVLSNYQQAEKYKEQKKLYPRIQDCFAVIFRNKLTTLLDELAGLVDMDLYSCWYYHYVIVEDREKLDDALPIRVPGGTVGGLYLDGDVITDVKIDTNYVIKTYPDDVNEIVKKFIGEKIVLC